MKIFYDLKNRPIRFTSERSEHIQNDHPEMIEQIEKIKEVLLDPDIITLSNTDESIELFYRFYEITPVTSKFLYVLVKNTELDSFIITSYFTNTIKKGDILWRSK